MSIEEIIGKNKILLDLSVQERNIYDQEKLGHEKGI